MTFGSRRISCRSASFIAWLNVRSRVATAMDQLLAWLHPGLAFCRINISHQLVWSRERAFVGEFNRFVEERFVLSVDLVELGRGEDVVFDRLLAESLDRVVGSRFFFFLDAPV